jgi:hypothetical protein
MEGKVYEFKIRFKVQNTICGIMDELKVIHALGEQLVSDVREEWVTKELEILESSFTEIKGLVHDEK